MYAIKTEGKEDDWLVGSCDEFSPAAQEDKEDKNDCEDDDDYKLKLTSFPASNSTSTDESGEEDEGQEYTKPVKMLYTCSIETCDGSQEKMDVDTFLEHWIYHKSKIKNQ